MKDQDWDAAIGQFYPFQNASDLQAKWVTWVGKGSPRIEPLPGQGKVVQAVAASDVARPSTELQRTQLDDEKLVPIGYRSDLVKASADIKQLNPVTQVGDGWTSRHKSKNAQTPSPSLASFSRVIHQRDDGTTNVSRPQEVNQSYPVVLQQTTQSPISNRVTEVKPQPPSASPNSKLKWLAPR